MNRGILEMFEMLSNYWIDGVLVLAFATSFILFVHYYDSEDDDEPPNMMARLPILAIYAVVVGVCAVILLYRNWDFVWHVLGCSFWIAAAVILFLVTDDYIEESGFVVDSDVYNPQATPPWLWYMKWLIDVPCGLMFLEAFIDWPWWMWPIGLLAGAALSLRRYIVYRREQRSAFRPTT